MLVAGGPWPASSRQAWDQANDTISYKIRQRLLLRLAPTPTVRVSGSSSPLTVGGVDRPNRGSRNDPSEVSK